MVTDIDLGKLMVADFDFQWVGFVRAGGRDLQAGDCARAANQPQHLLQTIQRFSSPVQTDGTKQAVFDGIPFRCACRVMGNRDGQAVLIGPPLQGVFPQTRAITVAASGVRLDQQASGLRIQPASRMPPPGANGIYGKLGCIRTRAHMHMAAIVRGIVNPIRSGTAHGVLLEIVGVYLARRPAPRAAGVLELADQLLFLGVYAEYGIAGMLMVFPLPSKVAELLVPIGMRRPGEPFHVHAEREAGLVQQPSDGARSMVEAASQLSQAQPHETPPRGRVASDLRLHRLLQLLLDLGRFFSTGGRPPPGSRVRFVGRSANPEANSSWPRRIVSGCSLVTRLIKATPPCPKRLASQATSHRRCCSSDRLSSRFSWACRSLSGCSSACTQLGHWHWYIASCINRSPIREAGGNLYTIT